MPDIAVDVQDIGRSGLVATYTTGLTLLDRYLFNNDGRTIVHVLEASGTATDVTVVTPGMVDGLAVADRVVTVAANTEAFIGPFLPSVYNDSAHKTALTFSSVTSVSIAALRLT